MLIHFTGCDQPVQCFYSLENAINWLVTDIMKQVWDNASNMCATYADTQTTTEWPCYIHSQYRVRTKYQEYLANGYWARLFLWSHCTYTAMLGDSFPVVIWVENSWRTLLMIDNQRHFALSTVSEWWRPTKLQPYIKYCILSNLLFFLSYVRSRLTQSANTWK